VQVLTDYSGLFGWWISSITFNIIFVILASIYLYRRKNREPGVKTSGGIMQWIKDFTFVWILLSLLVLYVASIGEGSYLLFASGNIVVEIVLVVYVMRSGKSGQAPTTSQAGPPSSSK
jgi:ABC-type multidrug transport system permease subunit